MYKSILVPYLVHWLPMLFWKSDLDQAKAYLIFFLHFHLFNILEFPSTLIHWLKYYIVLLFSRQVISDSLATPWTIKEEAPLSMGFPRQGILEWVAISFSKGSFWPRNWTHVSCFGRQILYHWVPREVHYTIQGSINQFSQHKYMAWKCQHELRIGQSMQTWMNKKLTMLIFLFLLQTLFQSFVGVAGGMGFPGSSAGKKSTCNAGDPGSIPGLGRSTGEDIALNIHSSIQGTMTI